MVDAVYIELGATELYAVNDVSLRYQEFVQLGTILSDDTSD
jgi:hypothetical protein